MEDMQGLSILKKKIKSRSSQFRSFSRGGINFALAIQISKFLKNKYFGLKMQKFCASSFKRYEYQSHIYIMRGAVRIFFDIFLGVHIFQRLKNPNIMHTSTPNDKY